MKKQGQCLNCLNMGTEAQTFQFGTVRQVITTFHYGNGFELVKIPATPSYHNVSPMGKEHHLLI